MLIRTEHPDMEHGNSHMEHGNSYMEHENSYMLIRAV